MMTPQERARPSGARQTPAPARLPQGNRKEAYYFNTAPECRAKAASLRTMAAFAQSPASKAKLMDMAQEWDAQAEVYDADS